MPTIPKISDSGTQNRQSIAPSDASGLPHPGRKISIRRMTTPAIPNKVAAIFPFRIHKSYNPPP
jgi:hypothetical protein